MTTSHMCDNWLHTGVIVQVDLAGADLKNYTQHGLRALMCSPQGCRMLF